MKRLLSAVAALALLTGTAHAQRPTNDPQAAKILLPNGWSLTPAGRPLPLGDLPLNMQLAPGGNMLAVTNNGQGKQSIQLIDPGTEKLLDERPIGKAWYGLAFDAKGERLYASGGNDNIILAYPTAGRKLGAPDTLRLGRPWPKAKISPTGLAVDAAGQRLYTVTKEDSALYVVDLKSKRTLSKVKLGAEAYGCLLSADGKVVYITLWGGDKLLAYDRATGRLRPGLPTGSHPNEVIQRRDGRYLFVANANDNSVSVIDAKAWKVLETISTSLYPTRLTGSTTNGLALSADQKTLYIANADNNCLAVFDVRQPGHSASRGFIPTGWYPTCVRVQGSKILVASGKGLTSLANPNGPQPLRKKDDSGYQLGSAEQREVQYIGSLFKGTLLFIPSPDAARLKAYTRQVYDNTPFTPAREKLALGEAGNPVPRRVGDKSPIKHVFYIIKENRTYDQIMGDVREGEGDTALCIFGQKVTPNHHALAREFVLLDNFYVNAEVSADGHNWSTAAYATDYVEKSWPISYGGRGGTYDFEGTRKIAYPRDGFIWDYCQRAGLTYRTYGEFAEDGKTPLKSLRGHVCPKSPGFNMDVTDQERERVWAQDFDSLLAKNAVPQFSTIRLSNDHTSGQRLGKVRPTAAVADNDLALGRLVEHLAQSSIWGESVVFVLEDDAQNGSDHIDAHRSPAYVIGPHVRHNFVDHTLYTTAGVMRTMELLLGLPPMSQYDAAARPLFGVFQATPNLAKYEAKPNQIPLDTRNTAWNHSAERSAKFDFAHEDAVPDLDLNEVVWKSVKGENSTMPAPRRGAFLQLTPKRKDDDD
ncbi:hypothetical protein A0257_04655 [Hymenobacter psoromatis]|nr:hypothetical protein A0257_04655 [Hymenobacter psoromatis]